MWLPLSLKCVVTHSLVVSHRISLGISWFFQIFFFIIMSSIENFAYSWSIQDQEEALEIGNSIMEAEANIKEYCLLLKQLWIRNGNIAPNATFTGVKEDPIIFPWLQAFLVQSVKKITTRYCCNVPGFDDKLMYRIRTAAKLDEHLVANNIVITPTQVKALKMALERMKSNIRYLAIKHLSQMDFDDAPPKRVSSTKKPQSEGKLSEITKNKPAAAAENDNEGQDDPDKEEFEGKDLDEDFHNVAQKMGNVAINDDGTPSKVAGGEKDGKVAGGSPQLELQGAARNAISQFHTRQELTKKNGDRNEAYITDPRMVATIVRLFLIAYPRGTCVFEPCEGTGAITVALAAAGFNVVSRDKFPRDGRCQEPYDVYTSPFPVTDPPIEVVFTNPPFDSKDDMMTHVESYNIPWGMILPMNILFSKFMEQRMASGRLQIYCLSKRPFTHLSNDPSVLDREVMIGNVGLFMMDFPTFNFGKVVNIGYEWAEDQVKLAVANGAATMGNMSL